MSANLVSLHVVTGKKKNKKDCVHIPGAPKSRPLKDSYFSRTTERYDTKKYTHQLPIHLFANVESFIILSTELTKLRCFSHGDLADVAVLKSLKILSTIQDGAYPFLTGLMTAK